MNITNKAKRPLSVPLPGGKKLFLSPGKTGQVTQKALAHPPLAKLLEAGDLETEDKGGTLPKNRGEGTLGAGGTRHGGSGAIRQSGDR